MAYTLNKPAAADLLSSSQTIIRDNFNTSDTVFGLEHYAFSNATVNKGFHNTVTTPSIIGGVHPTTTTDPKFYAIQDLASIGVIQYSRGPNDAVPTPVTTLQSGTSPIVLGPSAETNVIDFTGANMIIGTIYAVNSANDAVGNVKITKADFIYHLVSTGSVPTFSILRTGSSTFTFTTSASILKIQNSSPGGGVADKVFWTLVLHRIVI